MERVWLVILAMLGLFYDLSGVRRLFTGCRYHKRLNTTLARSMFTLHALYVFTFILVDVNFVMFTINLQFAIIKNQLPVLSTSCSVYNDQDLEP